MINETNKFVRSHLFVGFLCPMNKVKIIIKIVQIIFPNNSKNLERIFLEVSK
jgi:hypothetical protein